MTQLLAPSLQSRFELIGWAGSYVSGVVTPIQSTLDPEPVTVGKDDVPAAIQAAILNVLGLTWIAGGGGSTLTTFG